MGWVRDMKYRADFESLEAYRVPEWFRDAKFGIFIHWGIYSVPEKFTEWYPRYLYHTDRSLSEPEPHYVDGKFKTLTPEREIFRRELHHQLLASHVDRYGSPATFGYKDLIPLFTGSRFDPLEWMELFKSSGAGYVVPVAEHHDGFSMYATELNCWNAAEMGPRRDVIAELKAAAAEAGLKFGVSSHRAWNWRYYNFDEERGYDNTDPRYESFYGKPHGFDEPPSDEFVADWFARTTELIEKFEPDLLYFDFGWHEPMFAKHYADIMASLYNRGEKRAGAVLCHKGCLPSDLAVYDIERGSAEDIIKPYWQGDTSVSRQSWSYIVNDQLKTPARLIYDLVDTVSKNGNLLLNVGPRADGSIPPEVSGILRSIGDWLAVNGEAIYGTRHWAVFGEHSPQTLGRQRTSGQYSEADSVEYTHRDIRFTCKDSTVYAIMFDWPGMRAEIGSLGRSAGLLTGEIKNVSLLGCAGRLNWSRRDDALVVEMPVERPCNHAYALKVEL